MSGLRWLFGVSCRGSGSAFQGFHEQNPAPLKTVSFAFSAALDAIIPCMQKHSQPPLEILHANCSRLLPRLRLIPEILPWLNLCAKEIAADTPYTLLRKCFTLGVSICVLLDLLGKTPTPVHWPPYLDANDDSVTIASLTSDKRELYFASFIERVRMLEFKGILAYGEVLRVEDLHDQTPSGFWKILRAVERILKSLQDRRPDLFVAPHGAKSRRKTLIQELIDTERAHVSSLTSMTGFENPWGDEKTTLTAILECLTINRSRMLSYHYYILEQLEKAPSQAEEWEKIFAFDGNKLGTQVIGAYGSYCANYLTLANAVYEQGVSVESAETTEAVFQFLSSPLHRICNYRPILENILEFSVPDNEGTSYDSLCSTSHALSSVSISITEAATEIRTMYASQIIKQRAYVWNSATHPDELGTLLLDDIMTEWGKGTRYLVFMYEAALLVCERELLVDGTHYNRADEVVHEGTYPIHSWDLGPALKTPGPLNLVHHIKTPWFREVRCADPDSLAFELDWAPAGSEHIMTLVFCPVYVQQAEQWCDILRSFVPVSYTPKFATRSLSGAVSEEEESVISEDEGDADEDDTRGSGQRRRKSHARSWSDVARKGPCSESSSFIHQEQDDQPNDDDRVNSLHTSVQTLLDVKRVSKSHRSKSSGSSMGSSSGSSIVIHEEPQNAIYDLDKLSPGVIAALFSPLSPNFPKLDIGGDMSPEKEGYMGAEGDELVDLTAQIERDDRYPFAQGGFADVWKGTWHRGVDDDVKVAVKVIRSSPSDDPNVEKKLKKRLRKELNIWRRLKHDHVLPLHGTASDFGHYTSMVCPFLEIGSVTRYLERSGDILSMMDRLQLLCEVASGLAYLHSFSVVHGDLTGSNILITDDHKACLCDFGLSSIVADIKGSSYFTSSIGGAVRWAAAELYKVYEEEDEGLESDPDAVPAPTVTTFSDIYSFGSVMLEILSGRIPYHYVRNDAQVVIELNRGVKPRRPAVTFVHDPHWDFIQKCWRDEPKERPSIQEVYATMVELHRASLDFRRHTY